MCQVPNVPQPIPIGPGHSSPRRCSLNKPAVSFARDASQAPAAFLPLLNALTTMDEAGRRALGLVIHELLVPGDCDARIAFVMSGELPEDSIRRALSAMNHDA